jgi:ABC-type glycerol-3-phosphate transport system substrate-binding protein
LLEQTTSGAQDCKSGSDEHVAQLDVDATENETFKTKIRTAVAANEAPDIFTYWAGGYMKNFVTAGKLLALDDYLNDGTKDKLLDGTLDNMTFDGKVYGLPHTMDVGTFLSIRNCSTSTTSRFRPHTMNWSTLARSSVQPA